MPDLDVTCSIRCMQRNALLGALPVILKNVYNTSKFKALKLRRTVVLDAGRNVSIEKVSGTMSLPKFPAPKGTTDSGTPACLWATL